MKLHFFHLDAHKFGLHLEIPNFLSGWNVKHDVFEPVTTHLRTQLRLMKANNLSFFLSQEILLLKMLPQFFQQRWSDVEKTQEIPKDTFVGHFNSLVRLESFYLQDHSFFMQPGSCVLQRLWFPLLAAFFFSFIVQFYRSAGISKQIRHM